MMLAKVLKAIWKGTKAFFMFWQDFLIGDSPEIALGVVIILAISFAIRGSPVASAIILPLAVLFLLVFSLSRGRIRGD